MTTNTLPSVCPPTLRTLVGTGPTRHSIRSTDCCHKKTEKKKTTTDRPTDRLKAQAVQNPHKVEPIVATRIPAGSTYTQPIFVYNPRDAPTLAITEVREMRCV